MLHVLDAALDQQECVWLVGYGGCRLGDQGSFSYTVARLSSLGEVLWRRPSPTEWATANQVVVADDGNTLEVQMRTWGMHQTAEYGIAAHWRYKEGKDKDESFAAKIAWLRSLLEWRKEVTDATEFVDAMKTDVFRDRVYTFTPKGKLIDLPVGATPIDFAFQVHTEIGQRCRGARVNGKLVSLTSKEFQLLRCLVQSRGKVLTRETILQKVWGYDYYGTARTIDNFINRLRQKIEADADHPHHIVTVRGVGYKFCS